jgi:autotransporter-associated beta strand protein
VTVEKYGDKSFALVAGSITRSGASTLNVSASNPGGQGQPVAVQTTTPNTFGILGPWAFFGTGASTRYAVGAAVSGTSTTITGLTGTSAEADAFASATANYEFLATGTTTLTANRTANTARYATGTGNTIDTNGNTLTLNGLLNAGAGAVTVSGTGSVVLGSTNELVVNAANNTVTISAPITGGSASGGFTKTGAQSVTLSSTSNAYTGATTINAGSLILGAAEVIPDASDVTINTATATAAVLNLNGNSETIGSLNGSGSVTTASGTPLLTIGASNVASATFSGVIGNGSGTVGLTKTGTGTQTLSGTNTYTGNTLLSQGTLQFARQVSLYNNGTAAAWSNTNINVNSGATMAFNVGGTGEFTAANIVTLLGLADATTNGFKDGAILGLDTTTADFLVNSVIANPNSGANVLGLTKLGTNKLTLDQANTYTGVTTVRAGTLRLNGTAVNNTTILTDGNTATTSDIVINGGTLELALSEQIADSGSINMSSGAFNFGTATGKTETIDKFTNSGGTFSTGANILIGLGNTITWSGGTNTVNNGGSVQDLHIVISGGTNTVEGGATGGVLQLNSGGLGLEMSAGATLTLNSATAPAVAGKLLLSGNVSTSGDTTVTIANGGSGDNPGNIDLNNGTRTFTVADGAATTDMSISARITNTGSIIKDGAGTLSLNAENTYSGTTTITNGGTLIANVLGALPLTPRSAVSFTGTGTSALNLGANQFVASLSSAGAATVALGSNTLTVGIAGGNTTFAGSINGTGGNLVKDTNSTQVLSGANGYTGTTTVSAGTLEVQGSLSGTTAVTVNTSGTLLLNSAASPIINTAATMTVGGGTVKIDNSLSNTNQTFGSLTLTGTSILDFGTGSAGNTMTFSSLSFTGTKLNVYNWSGSAYGAGVADTGTFADTQDRLLFNADTIYSGTEDSRIEFFSDSGITSLGFGQEVAFGSQFELVPITAVPEPATTALIGSIALCALIGYRERRRFTGLGKRTAARK